MFERSKIGLWLSFCALTLGGCQRTSEFRAFLAEALYSEANEGRVLVRVDGLPITETDCREYLNRYPSEIQQNLQKFWVTPKGRAVLLNNLIREKIEYRLAQKSGIERDPNYLKRLYKDKKRLMIRIYRDQHRKPLPGLPIASGKIQLKNQAPAAWAEPDLDMPTGSMKIEMDKAAIDAVLPLETTPRHPPIPNTVKPHTKPSAAKPKK